MSNSLELALQACGWTRERTVPTRQWVQALSSEGFTMLPEAVAILENFGGLDIHPVRSATDAYAPSIIRFDPVLGASGEFDRFKEWQHRLHMRLSPLGQVGGQAALALAEDGRVFLLWSDE